MLMIDLSYLGLLDGALRSTRGGRLPGLRTAFISEPYSSHGDVIWSSELIIQVIYFQRWMA